MPALRRPLLQELLTDQDIHYPQERPGSRAKVFSVWGLGRKVES